MYAEIFVRLLSDELGFCLDDPCRLSAYWTGLFNRKGEFPHAIPPVCIPYYSLLL